MSNYTGEPHKRTNQQSRALHLFFTELSNELNDHGVTIQKFTENAVQIEFTPRLVKELIWRPIQKALTSKGSTADLDKVTEIDLIYDHIIRHIGELYGIFIEFPHRDPNDIAPLK